MKGYINRITSWTSFPALTLLISFMLLNAVLMPNFLTKSFFSTFFMTSTPTLCIAMGICAAKISGGIDISLGSLLALVNVVIAKLCDNKSLDFSVILLIGLLVGLLGGALNGLMIGYFRVTPLLATFASNSVFAGLALWVLPATGGFNIPRSYLNFYNSNILGFPVTLFYILLPLVVWLFYSLSPNGIYVYAIGKNEQNAYLSGMPVTAAKFFVYLFGGLCAAIGGLAITGMTASGDPLVGTGFTMTAIAGVVIGGVSLEGGEGDIFGAIFGSLFLSVLLITVVSTQVGTFTQDLVTSLIMFIGLAGSVIIRNRSRHERSSV